MGIEAKSSKTVLVTGANSGVGMEAARQLAAAGWGKVILACRTEEKAGTARTLLVEKTGKDPFATLVIDTAEIASANTAGDELRERGERIDFLLLNAGASSAKPKFNSDGVELTWASTLVGHHVLTMRMLADGLLSPNARIVIVGSEAARGTAPGMKVHDISGVAAESFAGRSSRSYRCPGPSQRTIQVRLVR
jgi:NAD(P)-dependent dehydrogenase (short-subunit alcohol dehydrogenase family)